MSQPPEDDDIMKAIGITLLCIIIFVIFINNYPQLSILSFKEKALYSAIYVIAHPIIGKIFTAIVLLMCKGIDFFYDTLDCADFFDDGGRAIIFASAWWLTAPIGLVIASITLLYGAMYKLLFK